MTFKASAGGGGLPVVHDITGVADAGIGFELDNKVGNRYIVDLQMQYLTSANNIGLYTSEDGGLNIGHTGTADGGQFVTDDANYDTGGINSAYTDNRVFVVTQTSKWVGLRLYVDFIGSRLSNIGDTALRTMIRGVGAFMDDSLRVKEITLSKRFQGTVNGLILGGYGTGGDAGTRVIVRKVS